MKYKLKTLSSNLLKEFLSSNLHITSTKHQVDRTLYGVLYGFRNNIGIFNLTYTFISLKKLLVVINQLISNRKLIVFFGLPTWLDANWKELNKQSKGKFQFLSENEDLNYLVKNSKNIGLIFIFNSEFTKTSRILHLSRELFLPTSGFVNVKSLNYDFPVFGNFKSKKSLIFFYHLLSNTLK
jgi:ribosomal protein S2